MRDKLQVLYETPGAAPHPFAAHPRVPEAVRKRVTAAFLKQASDGEGPDAPHRVREILDDLPARDRQRLPGVRASGDVNPRATRVRPGEDLLERAGRGKKARAARRKTG